MDSAEWDVARLYMALRFVKRSETPAQLQRRGATTSSSSSDNSTQQQQQQPLYSGATTAATGAAAAAGSSVQQAMPAATLGKSTVCCRIYICVS